jgi:hypothetical protein
MVTIESTQQPQLQVPDPDRLQQLLNRLNKHYEDLKPEDRRVTLIYQIKRMDLPKADRDELLRRIG